MGGSARTVVFGYGELAIVAVESLVSVGAELVAAVIPSNRTGHDVDQFRTFSERSGLPVLVQPPRKSVDPFVQQLRELSPDFILVWSYPMILPKSVINVPRRAAFNMHGGILPEYRGGHVMQWAIINGEKETGITLHYIEEGIDTGAIVAESRFSIDWNDDAASVREKLKSHGRQLLKEWWPLVAAGQTPKRVQDEQRAQYYRLRTQEDGLISWNQSSLAIYNLVRALVSPWPGAYTYVRGHKLTVWRVDPVQGRGEGVGFLPGRIVAIDDSGATVLTGDGSLVLQKVEIDGCILTGRALQDLVKVDEELGI